MSVEVSSLLPLPSAPSSPGAAADEASVCANCGQSLHGPFCSNCGQHVKDLHRSVWRFVADFADNVFCWDNKLFRTLLPLFTQPGEITLDYLAGRRVRYVHPLRLFLFTSAVCLTIIQYLGGNPAWIGYDARSEDKKHHKPGWNVQFGSPPPAAAASPTPESHGLSIHFGDPSPVPAASGSTSPAPAAVAPGGTTAPVSAPKAHGDDDDDEDDDPAKAVAGAINQTADEVQRAAAAKDHAAGAEAAAPAGEDFGDRLAHRAEARIKAAGGTERIQKEISTDVQRRVSYVALVLLPIFAMMLRGLYWRRDSYYFAHLIFSLHYHTFLLLFVAAYTLLALGLPTSFWPVRTLLHTALLLGPGGYLFLALRRLYGESVKRSLCKVVVLGGMHLLVLFIGLAIVGGLAIYHALS